MLFRYMLVKDETKKSKVPTPNKLEEELLRQRFPAQHRAVIRAMKDMHVTRDGNAEPLAWRFSGDFSELLMDDHVTDSTPPEPNPHPYSDSSVSFHSRHPSEPNTQASLKASSGTSISSKRSYPSVSACTPINYPPISVLHRKTCNYSPTSFRV